MFNRCSNGWKMSGSRRGGRGGFQRGYGAQDDLTRAMGRMSFRSTTQLTIPPLSSFAFPSPEEAVAGRSVKVGEPIDQADNIPTNYLTTAAYLKVSKVATSLSTMRRRLRSDEVLVTNYVCRQKVSAAELLLHLSFCVDVFCKNLFGHIHSSQHPLTRVLPPLPPVGNASPHSARVSSFG